MSMRLRDMLDGEFTPEWVVRAMYHYEIGATLALLGERWRDAGLLGKAAGAFRNALGAWDGECASGDRAATQNALGTTLLSLGERENDAGLLDRSVAAFRAALADGAGERDRFDQVATRGGLVTALFVLSERNGETGLLEQEVAALRAALEEPVRVDRTATPNRLGLALFILDDRQRDAGLLEETVAAFRAALDKRARDCWPPKWIEPRYSVFRCNHSNWHHLGSVGLDYDRVLHRGVAVLRSALAERARERAPADPAATRNELGLALGLFGARSVGVKTREAKGLFEEAAASFRAALETYSPERTPLEWAETQENLGAAIRLLGVRKRYRQQPGPSFCSKDYRPAVAAFRAALEVYSPKRTPLEWVRTQWSLGMFLCTWFDASCRITVWLGPRTHPAISNLASFRWAADHHERRGNRKILEEAVTAFRAALQVPARKYEHFDRARIQGDLGVALIALGEIQHDAGFLQEAVATFRAALEVHTRELWPLEWARLQDRLGTALRFLGALERDTGILAEAVAAFRAALEVRTRDRSLPDWVQTQEGLGTALRLLGVLERDTGLLEDAVTAYHAALGGSVTPDPSFGKHYNRAQTLRGLGVALLFLGELKNSDDILQEAKNIFGIWDPCCGTRRYGWSPLATSKGVQGMSIALAVEAARAGDSKILERARNAVMFPDSQNKLQEDKLSSWSGPAREIRDTVGRILGEIKEDADLPE